ncbi:MAG: heavy-metal-associated domain-containing protein, partial [Chitinophagaceae bacterium]
VQCDMCKRKIEDFLKYEERVTKVVVYPKQKKTTVTYLTDRTNLENIKTAIANTGYDAEEVKAEKDAYNKLPACCKKPSGK